MDNIGFHLKNVYFEGELVENSTTEESLVVQIGGIRRVNRSIWLYNLDAIISIGYKINSLRGTQFRIWATHDANKEKIWSLNDMDADHVAAWSKGGKTAIKNCQMLCKTHNRAKGNR